jgi:hypothetical protein
MFEVLVCVGAGSVLLLGAVLIPFAQNVRRKKRQQVLLSSLMCDDPAERASVGRWLSRELSPEDRVFALTLLNAEDPRVRLDVATMLFKGPERASDALIESVVDIACSGDPNHRHEAIMLLRGKCNRCPQVARAMISRLPEEPNAGLRLDIITLLVDMVKGDLSPLDFSLRCEIAKAVTRRLLDPVREVRFAARINLQMGGGLRYLIKEVELTLMEILRSNEQDSVDAAAAIILENKAVLKAAMSCIPASKASPSLVRAIL